MRRLSSQKKLTAKTTQMAVMARSIGHSSSAYSLPWVSPSGRVMAAAAMMACQPQKCSEARAFEGRRAFTRRWVE